MKTYIKTIWTKAMLCICTCTLLSCSDKDGPHVVDPFRVSIRFESPIGTNIADSLNIIDNTKPETWNAKKEDIQVRVYRGSDLKPLEINRTRWAYIKENTIPNFLGGTTLNVSATDLFGDEKRISLSLEAKNYSATMSRIPLNGS